MRDRLIAVLGEVALYYSSNKNYIKALEYVKRMKQIGGLRSFHKAYEATLYLMLNEFSIAESQLKQITLENATAKDPDDRYSYLYCRSILSSIEGNEGR